MGDVLNDQYFEFLDLVSDLYPTSEDSSFAADKQELNNWAAAVVVFETQKQAVPPNFDKCEFILQSETFEALMLVIARRFNASKDPDSAVNLFDYGKEKKSREDVRQNIKQLSDIIIAFYSENKNLLDDESCNENPLKPSECTDVLLVEAESHDDEDTAADSTDAEIVLPGLIESVQSVSDQIEPLTEPLTEMAAATATDLVLDRIEASHDEQAIAINFREGGEEELSDQALAQLEAIEDTFAELELSY